MSGARLHSVEGQDDWWMINCKWYGRKWSGPNWIIFWHVLGGTKCGKSQYTVRDSKSAPPECKSWGFTATQWRIPFRSIGIQTDFWSGDSRIRSRSGNRYAHMSSHTLAFSLIVPICRLQIGQRYSYDCLGLSPPLCHNERSEGLFWEENQWNGRWGDLPGITAAQDTYTSWFYCSYTATLTGVL
jgi:hypothetical protein